MTALSLDGAVFSAWGLSTSVIASRKAAWQSASPAVQSTVRPRRGRKENGLPQPFGLRNDMEWGNRSFCMRLGDYQGWSAGAVLPVLRE